MASQREDFILLRDKAYLTLEKLKDEFAQGKKVDLTFFENAAREYHLRAAALRMYEIYERESAAKMGKWTSSDHFIYYRCANMLNQIADLGETFYDIKRSENRLTDL